MERSGIQASHRLVFGDSDCIRFMVVKRVALPAESVRTRKIEQRVKSKRVSDWDSNVNGKSFFA